MQENQSTEFGNQDRKSFDRKHEESQFDKTKQENWNGNKNLQEEGVEFDQQEGLSEKKPYRNDSGINVSEGNQDVTGI